MIQYIRFLALSLFISIGTIAQTTLPTYWDFATTPNSLPTGWSTNTTNNYSSGIQDQSGGTSRAGKMDATGEFFTIHFFDQPSAVDYQLKAYSGSNSNFEGTLTVQESDNGSNWTTVFQHTNNSFGSSWQAFSHNLNASTRYVRFFYTNKISGVNTGIDEVTVSEFVPLDEEINLVYDGSNVPSNTSITFSGAFSNTTTVALGVENLGSQGTLQLTGSSLSGTASADYSVTSLPSSVGPLSNDSIYVEFTPSSGGNRPAVLSIDNSDNNEDPYLIQLNGIGGANVQEPDANPTTLQVDLLKTYRIAAEFNAVTADKYVVLVSRNQAVDAAPVDGVLYEKGQGIGNAKIVSSGSSTQFWINEATADDTFYVEVYAYNGIGSFSNYRTDNPLSETIVSPIDNYRQSNYYNTIDVNDNSFPEDLHDVIDPHLVLDYDEYDEWMIPRLVRRDTIGGQGALTCVYSNDVVVFNPPFNWNGTGMNREHTLPASWMPSAGSQSTAEYQDYHHLFPTISTANGQRGNDPLGEVVNVSSSYGAGKRGSDAFGNTVYEPKAAQKGDAARAIFYMLTAYHNPQGGDSWGLDDLQSNGPQQRLSVLLEWHLNDLPSGEERARNDFLDSLQRNRNPFVDSAHFACYIDFNSMEYITEPDSDCLERARIIYPEEQPVDTTDSTTGINYHAPSEWQLYPNPASDHVQIIPTNERVFQMILRNSHGQIVRQKQLQGPSRIEVEEFPAGLYFLSVADKATASEHTFQLLLGKTRD